MKDLKGDRVKKLHQEGKNARCQVDTAWEAIGKYIRINMQDISGPMDVSLESYSQNLYSFRAYQALNIAAQGFYNYITPHSEIWQIYGPPDGLEDDDEVIDFCDRVTRISAKKKYDSNFYQVWMEDLLNHIGYASSLLFCQSDGNGGLNYKEFNNGSYCFYENNFGTVDQITREETFTAIKALKEFGEENLPDQVMQDVNSKDPARYYNKHNFIYYCGPREDSERQIGKIDANNRPIAEIWVHEETGKTVKEDGYFTFPYIPGRYLKWGDSPYGFGPSMAAIFGVRQLNFMELNMDIGMEKWFNPPMAVPSGMEERLDLSAGGENYVNGADPNAKIYPLHTVGDPNAWHQRMLKKEEDINELYFVELFTMIAGKTKEMTALEVKELTEEKVVLFTSAYLRLENEKLKKLAEREFDVLVRQGVFGQIPAQMTKDGTLEVPKITYSSKMSQAIKAFENSAIERSLQFVQAGMQVDPSVVDNIKLDDMTDGYMRNMNLPYKYQNSKAEKQKIREDRQQQQEQQMAMEAVEPLSKAAKNANDAGIDL